MDMSVNDANRQGSTFFFAPLNSIERFHYFDSSDRFPNRIMCRLLVNQAIDPVAGKQACFWLGERHPVLKCSIEKRGGKLVWMCDPDRYRWFDQSNVERSGSASMRSADATAVPADRPWFFSEQLERPPDGLPDFSSYYRRAGNLTPLMLIRQWSQQPPPSTAVGDSPLRQQPQPSLMAEIWLSIHHAYCDGGGGVAIINDWIQIYENIKSNRAPTEGMSSIDHSRFRHRNNLGLLSWKFLRKLPFQLVGLFGAAKFIFRSSATLDGLNPQSPSSLPNQQPSQAIASGWLSETDLANLEKDAQQQNYNFNARLVAELFVALERWRLVQIPAASPYHWQRIILPINVRDIGDRRLSAANKSSIVQIDRRRVGGETNPSMVQSIQREIGVIIQWKLDRMFLVFIKVIGLFPSLLRHVAQNKKHRGIAVFTNLGQPFRRLDKRNHRRNHELDRNEEHDCQVQPIEIDFLAPLRHGTSLNFTLARYDSRLRVTLHYDPAVIQQQQATALSEMFLKQLQSGLVRCHADRAVPPAVTDSSNA